MRILTYCAAALLLSGCGTTAMSGMGVPGLGARQAQMPVEDFNYAPAANRNVRVAVAEVVSHGNPDFIPSDPNWIQVRLTVSNIGSRTINFTDAKAQLANGTVLGSARAASELLKPPSMVATTAGMMGMGAASTLVGAFIFPPAAIIGGAAMVLGPMFMADRMAKTVERVNREGIQAGPVAPGTSTSGLLFVPAVTGQTALIVFYEIGSSSESLVVTRRPN